MGRNMITIKSLVSNWKNPYLPVFLLIPFWLLLAQFSFSVVQSNQTQTTVKTLNSFFTTLLGPSNFEILTNVITDLENTGVIRCPVIYLLNHETRQLVLDLSYRGDCDRPGWELRGERTEINMKAGNGDEYSVELSTINSPSFHFALWFVRIVGILMILGLNYLRLFRLAQIEKLHAIKLGASEEISEMAKQVSHDIRSPLAALNLIMASTNSLPEDKRLLIRSAVNRINDIANNLLSTRKVNLGDDSNPQKRNLPAPMHFSEQVMLLPLVDSIVSEKRFEYRAQQSLSIEADLSGGYGLFVEIDPGQLKRVISNLINNSAEAMIEQFGSVTISIKDEISKVSIVLQDNGRGIPAFIIARLGDKGFSYGKINNKSGSGIGLYHAKKTIEAAGGSLSISSIEGKGTTVRLTLPKSEPPSWFISELNLTEHCIVVALDDDISIHQIWKDRFRNQVKEGAIELYTFSSVVDFKQWVFSNLRQAAAENVDKRFLFLVDYELLKDSQSGLDVIQNLRIESSAFLVTSRFDEAAILKRAVDLKVKVIPKISGCISSNHN